MINFFFPNKFKALGMRCILKSRYASHLLLTLLACLFTCLFTEVVSRKASQEEGRAVLAVLRVSSVFCASSMLSITKQGTLR